MSKIYNFSAGPSMLPRKIMKKVKKEFLNWNNTGCSVIEISHRSEKFLKVVKNSKKNLRKLLKIPDNYSILFCQGGARGQFSAIPMNLLNNKNDEADYIYTGHWSNSAYLEAKKYCNAHKINVIIKKNNKKKILPIKKWLLNENSQYLHYCPNETIEGISIYEDPIFKNQKIVIGDFSSLILSRPINVNKYSIIYAGAQKNIGPSGITLIIIKKKLIYKINSNLIPSILDYKILLKSKSLFNTPTTFSWYISGLVFKWLNNLGGLKKIEKKNFKKSKLLYTFIDNSNYYINNINKKNRSITNIVFNTPNKKLDNLFVKKSIKKGLLFLKNHYLLGGLRASLYNSMSIKGVNKLIKFMDYFQKKYKK